uniref:CR-type domain-containing protein n=1 Tax=Zea mays TaxID=4577 RepID=A0A804M2U3_MAIZE
MELLLRRGHVDPSAFAAASLSSKHANAVRTACLRFGRQRPELIRHISRCDIQVALRCGCPSIDRKVVNSGKRLRAYVGLVEGEFFRNIFRDRDFGSHDIKVALELSFMEAVQGCSKTINFQTSVTCETCNGAGVPPGTKPETCLACRGSGFMFMQTGPFRMQSTCTKCGGSGKTVKVFH